VVREISFDIDSVEDDRIRTVGAEYVALSYLRKLGIEECLVESGFTKREVLEGLASGNPKAKFGRSKEKRSDCCLLTLGLVIDGKGFPKTSKVFSDNQSEPKTLLGMNDALREQDPTHSVEKAEDSDKPTVVIDAGIATEENLSELKEHYHYKSGSSAYYP